MLYIRLDQQLNVDSNQSFLETVDNKVIFKRIRVYLTDLTNLITFSILILLHTASKIGMSNLLYILDHSL